VKQATARLMYQRAGILSHSNIMMSLGYDPERQKMEVQADFDEMKDYTVLDNGTLLQIAQSFEKENDERRKSVTS
jgi:protein tyrosine phosphatase